MTISDYHAGVRLADQYLAGIGWEYDASCFADTAPLDMVNQAIAWKNNFDWPNLDQAEAFTHRLGFTFGH